MPGSLFYERTQREENTAAPTVLDICTGAGGEALGLENAGFSHAAVVEIEPVACQTLRTNRPLWRVIESDIRAINGLEFRGVDLLAGGVPCPPFTIAGKQLGADDERDLFPEALHLIEQIRPKAVMLENVPGFASAKFASYRNDLISKLMRLHYEVQWRILQASDYGVPQLRPRFVLVALRQPYAQRFGWPIPQRIIPTVSQAISDLMASRGWAGVAQWYARANTFCPTATRQPGYGIIEPIYGTLIKNCSMTKGRFPMPTLEERVQALEKELAERKHSEEMLTIAVRALVSKEAFENLQETIEKYQEQNGKLFNVIINQNALHNDRLTDLQSQIIDLNGKLDGKVTVLNGKIATLQSETRQQLTEARKDITDLKTDVSDLKSVAQQILARLPEKP